MRPMTYPIVCCSLLVLAGCATPAAWTSSAGGAVASDFARPEPEPTALAIPTMSEGSRTPSPLLAYADAEDLGTDLLERLALAGDTSRSDAALSLTGFQPGTFADAMPPQDQNAQERTLPVGIGFTAGPSTFLLGASLDVPIDENLTAGPALHLGFSDNRTLMAPFAQVRYWLKIDDDKEQKFRPFVQGGFGAVYLDKDGRKDDWGPLLNIGAGLRFKTGSFWRLGSTVLINFVPGDVAGESAYFSWEVIQIVFPI